MKKYLYYFGAAVLVLVVLYILLSGSDLNRGAAVPPDHKDAEYVIEGQKVKLNRGVAEEEVSGSASKIVTRYFGNEARLDLNDDGREDVVFLLTQDRGGSGTFFYAVAALNTEAGYLGSDGYLLGDRIAPQTTERSQNPRHQNVIVVNYADRKPGEPMSVEPSVGKIVYIKLDLDRMQWGFVVPDFEGESANGPIEWSGTVIAGSARRSPLLLFTKTDYDAALQSGKLILLYFYANWCPICKRETADALYPAFNDLARADVIGFRVNYNDSDTDAEEKNLARAFGVAYQHTKVFVKNGVKVLKSPESWDKGRYLLEIDKAANANLSP